MAAPQREPRVKLQPLNENLADTLKLAQGDVPSTLEPTMTTSAESIHVTSRAPKSTRSTPPPATLVSIARVQKLEDYMATLLHHTQP